MTTRRSWFGVVLAGGMLSACGCEAKPGGVMTKAQAEKDLAERLFYSDVTLEDRGGGRFVGTAKDDKGDTANVDVTYTKTAVKWESFYKSADGRITRQSGGSTAR